ncbi:hypothetical protein DA2_2053 [Desulfovibrio sp. A2]|nr:hypothetical protein DA2_2053 [Desulfovibrio sp. A2]
MLYACPALRRHAFRHCEKGMLPSPLPLPQGRQRPFPQYSINIVSTTA